VKEKLSIPAEEVLIAYNEGQVDMHAYIKVKVNVREDNGTIKKN
jgi:DNA-directed RNA polymerase subunit beta'